METVAWAIVRASLYLEIYSRYTIYIIYIIYGSRDRLNGEIRSGEESRYWPRYWMGLVSRLCTRRHPWSGKLTVRKGWRASIRFSFHSFKRKRTSVLTRTACYREEMVKRCRSGTIIKSAIFCEDWRRSRKKIFLPTILWKLVPLFLFKFNLYQ